VEIIPPQNRNEFEAAADRAREKARSLAAEGMADRAESDRRAEAAGSDRGPLMAVVDRIRSGLSTILGR
jgi:hypothetical protein